MNKIRSITEAFSMQPSCYYVDNIYNNKRLEKIVPESVKVNGDPFEYYVGYADDGSRMFEYRKETVNVWFD